VKEGELGGVLMFSRGGATSAGTLADDGELICSSSSHIGLSSNVPK